MRHFFEDCRLYGKNRDAGSGSSSISSRLIIWLILLTTWKAVASVPKSIPVCAFALFPAEKWFPLANCQAN